MSNDSTYIMVLNDGETFTDLDGCAIYRVPASEVDDIEDALRNGNMTAVAHFEVLLGGPTCWKVTNDLTVGKERL